MKEIHFLKERSSASITEDAYARTYVRYNSRLTVEKTGQRVLEAKSSTPKPSIDGLGTERMQGPPDCCDFVLCDVGKYA
ncbi:MAG: hypothetical protein GY820_20065 [Gammaproteobacteria bacterium]|nr:hypothetical protein [Gammaproteobacteria bacterium]